MTPASYQLSLNFEQVLALVKQLPYPEKLLLSQELEKEVLNSQLTALLESFKTKAKSISSFSVLKLVKLNASLTNSSLSSMEVFIVNDSFFHALINYGVNGKA